MVNNVKYQYQKPLFMHGHSLEAATMLLAGFSVNFSFTKLL